MLIVLRWMFVALLISSGLLVSRAHAYIACPLPNYSHCNGEYWLECEGEEDAKFRQCEDQNFAMEEQNQKLDDLQRSIDELSRR